jgi:hypothetical protein
MLRRIVATISLSACFIACVAMSTATLAMDPSLGQSWRQATGPSAIAYFSLPLGHTKLSSKPAYGIALTAPTLRSYGTAPRMIAGIPRLLDLRFDGTAPSSQRVSGQLAWMRTSATRPDTPRRHMSASMDAAGWALSIIGTGLLTWGVYELVGNGKECPSPFTVINGICGPNSNN